MVYFGIHSIRTWKNVYSITFEDNIQNKSVRRRVFFFAKSIYIFTGILSIRCIITKRSMLKSSIIIFDLCICLPFLSILWYFIYFEAMLWDLHKFKIVSFPDALTLIIRKYPSLSLTRLLVWMSTLFYISFLLLSIFRIYVFHPLLSISLLYLMAFF